VSNVIDEGDFDKRQSRADGLLIGYLSPAAK
jgi:hypothetical protein